MFLSMVRMFLNAPAAHSRLLVLNSKRRVGISTIRFKDAVSREISDLGCFCSSSSLFQSQIPSFLMRKAGEEEKISIENQIIQAKKPGHEEIKEEEEPPPEKPLPDDCCGSGCVRCVWDVYYEELETYNERQMKKSEDKSRKIEE